MGNEHGKAGGGTATPAGIQSMDEALQKRFAKGIQFNSETVGGLISVLLASQLK